MTRRAWIILAVVCGLGALVIMAASRRPPLYGREELLEHTRGLMLQAKHKDTMRLCTRFLASDPNCAEVHHTRGYARLCLEHWDEAVEDFDTAIKLESDLARAYVDRAYALEVRGRYEDADRDLDRAIELSTERIEADRDAAEAYSDRAWAYAAKGEHEKSLADASKAIALDPEDAHGYLVRARARNDQGETGPALADLESALKIKPAAAAVYCERGDIRYSDQQLDQAIEDYTRALTINPRYAAAYRSRAKAYHAKEQPERALDGYARAIRSNKRSAWAYFGRAAVYLHIMDARARLKGGWGWLDWVRFAQRYRRAMRDLDQALALDPRMAIAHGYRGDLKWMRGEDKQARKEWQTSVDLLTERIEARPHRASAYYWRGIAYSRCKEWESARADLEKTVELDASGCWSREAEKYLQWLEDEGH